MKRKFSQWFNKYINADTIKMAILFVPLVYLLVKEIRQGEFSLNGFLDVGILVSFLLVAICELIAGLLGDLIGSRCEDATKLTEDYKQLCKKYPRESFIKFGEEKCPVICLCQRKRTDPPYTFLIRESEGQKRYELPKQVSDRADVLMNAHRYSTVYNRQNVRLDDLKREGNKVVLEYSATMYFDSLITNRAMDYDWGDGKTVREVYEPGPFLNSLKDSKLSNHLGFNGFVETSDGKYIFVMRYGKVSIGKRTLANSIGASMKTEYCLDDDRRFTEDGLYTAIHREIRDELKIEIADEAIKDEKKRADIFAFYRDVVEGGKPQFLFYYKTDLSSSKLQEIFKGGVKKDKKKRKKFLTDGKKLIFIPKEELESLVLTPGSLQRGNGKTYKMMPSAVAAVKMLQDYLEK